jgi:hypothetical protein
LLARIAGLFYLLTGGTAFAFIVRSKLIASANAAISATNILEQESLFRWSILADLAGIACHIVVTALFYHLFKPVCRVWSLVAAFVGLVGCAIQANSCVFEYGGLLVLKNAASSGAFVPIQMRSIAFIFLKLHSLAFNTAIMFFGLYCILIGYLVFRSTFLPRVIGGLVVLSGLAFVAANVAYFVGIPLPGFVSSSLTAIGGIGELILMLWLLIRGLNVRRWEELSPATPYRLIPPKTEKLKK